MIKYKNLRKKKKHDKRPLRELKNTKRKEPCQIDFVRQGRRRKIEKRIEEDLKAVEEIQQEIEEIKGEDQFRSILLSVKEA